MKLFTTSEIQQLEGIDIASRANRDAELMSVAAFQFTNWLLAKLNRIGAIHICCGHGNNGADGLLVAEKLYTLGYAVQIYIRQHNDNCSRLFLYHYQRVKALQTIDIKVYRELLDYIQSDDVIVDALLGIGINRALTGEYSDIVSMINDSKLPVYSLDVPTGLRGEAITYHKTVQAHATFSLQFPKLSFFLRENQKSIGQWDYESIGIQKSIINKFSSRHVLIDAELIRATIRKREAFSHKGTYGHAAVIAGEYGMAGAAVLCAKAAVHSGVGLLSIHGVDENRNIYQSCLPEALFKSISSFFFDEKLTYILGPGLTDDHSLEAVIHNIITLSSKPLVIDAGALNYMSRNKELLLRIPRESIITPHPKEFVRLFGPSNDSYERLQLQVEMSIEHGIIIVLKDHYTTITVPDGSVYYNTTGNAGLSTGGTGDVLTGALLGPL